MYTKFENDTSETGIVASFSVLSAQKRQNEMTSVAELVSVVRRGEDLLMSMELQLVEALCGFKRPVQTLDSRTLLITSHPGKCTHQNALQPGFLRFHLTIWFNNEKCD